MPIIFIPSKGATGSLSRSAKSFAPGQSGGFELMNITVNWEPGQRSGPVSFSFTLNQPSKRFPAGKYSFAGHVATDDNPCPNHGSTACGIVQWPGPDQDEVPWESTGGPVDEEEETEDPSSYDEPSDEDEASKDDEASEDEKPSACGEKPADE